ncbi:MAG: HDIG domain-containing metalloprotein [Cyanobacteriota bacterium]
MENINKDKNTLGKYLSYLSSLEGQRLIVTVIAVILVTFILCSRYFSFQSVISDNIAKQEIIANKTIEVVDVRATELKRKEAAAKVKPAFKPVEGDVDEAIENRLLNIFRLVSQLRQDIVKDSTKAYKLDTLVKTTPLETLDTSIVAYLLVEASDYNWEIIQSDCDKILKKILKQGISGKELGNSKVKLIKSYLSRTTTEENKKSIIVLVDYTIDKPNIEIDNEQTNLAKKNAMEAVEDVKVYFKKGRLVVEKGQSVTPVQYEALKKLGYTVDKMDWLLMFGVFCFVIIAFYVVWYYLSRYEPRYANSPKYLALLGTLAVVSVAVARIIPDFPRIYNESMPVYILPIAAVTLIISFFTNPRISLLVTSMIMFLITVIFHFPIEDVSVLLIGIIVAVFKSSKMTYYRDTYLIECGVAVGLAQVLVVLSNFLIGSTMYFDYDLQTLFYKSLFALVGGFITGAITIAAMPHLEALFKIVTAHGLMELSDQNQPLLRRLQFEAPGTYHHSLMVSTLAEAAAEAIGASSILVRVGAFYHDIGKLKRPSFFIENQSYFGSENPHNKLNPRLSKMVLTAHTKDGLELSRQYQIPEAIQNIIVEHHGDGVMLYFYMSALESEGPDKVIKDQFRYSGPKPSSKESAIVMLADATESAVRSLNNPSITDIEEMIKKIINERVEDGQLSDSPLTLKDIKVIQSTFIRVLRGMQHHRIEYHDNMLEELGKKQSESARLKQDKNSVQQQNQPQIKNKEIQISNKEEDIEKKENKNR